VSLQIFNALSIIFVAAYVVFNAWDQYKHVKTDSSIVANVFIAIGTFVVPLLMFIVWMLLLPRTLTAFTLITNTEMMKDNELIERTIFSHRRERAKLSYRIYQ